MNDSTYPSYYGELKLNPLIQEVPGKIIRNEDGTIKEVIQSRVYLNNWIYRFGSYPDGKDSIFTIQMILEIWGVQEHYDEMIERFKRLIAHRPDEILVCQYDAGEFKEDHEHQKLLFWSIFDTKKKTFGMCGGVLFQGHEMSFHT